MLCQAGRAQCSGGAEGRAVGPQVADLQVNLKAEVEVVEEKKTRTLALIESIGQEKATVDEAVESSRADEEDAAKLQVRKHRGPWKASPRRRLHFCLPQAFLHATTRP